MTYRRSKRSWRQWSVFLSLAILAAPVAAQACGPAVEIEFTEDAPKDRFEIRNVSNGAWGLTSLSIQLAGSKGDLVFDTAPGGEGLSVYQPFEASRGAADVKLRAAPLVRDGERALELEFDAFWSGKDFDFTIDLDDRLPLSEYGQTMVSGAEIEGAVVIADFVDEDGVRSLQKGTFGPDARAVLNGGTCA